MPRTVATTVVVAMVLLAMPNIGRAQTPERPNILVIVTDDQRPGTFGTMPDLRSWLGRGGTEYENGYASTPLCCPARASIMTGRYAHNHAVTSNTGHETLDHSSTMTRYLNDAGYKTGMFGKFLNGWPREEPPPHFDRYAVMTPPGYYDVLWNIDGVVQRIHTYSTKVVRYRATDFIRDAEDNDSKPWFAYVAPYAPHGPYIPETKYEDLDVGRWRGNPAVRAGNADDKPPWLHEGVCDLACGRAIRRGQLRQLATVDDMVAGIRNTLKLLGETNTIVFYISDNGFMWGDHGLYRKTQPYMPSAQVPFFMRWPGRVPAGVSSSDLVLNIDIAPTALEAADVALPEGAPPFDGRSLLSSPTRDRVLLEHWCNLRGCDHYASTTTNRYQYVERYDANGAIIFREYYDLVVDPWQLSNVFGDGNRRNNPDRAALHEQLMDDYSCAGRTCP